MGLAHWRPHVGEAGINRRGVCRQSLAKHALFVHEGINECARLRLLLFCNVKLPRQWHFCGLQQRSWSRGMGTPKFTTQPVLPPILLVLHR